LLSGSEESYSFDSAQITSSSLYACIYSLNFLLFFLTTMGEKAKKKRAADARAAKKAKTAKAMPVEAPASASTDPTAPTVPTSSNVPTQSNARNSKKTGTAPRVPSVPSSVRSVPTRQSTHSIGSSSTLGTGKKHTSANLEGTDNGKTRPKRSATARAMALLQELQLSETEETECDPEGVFTGNDELDMIMETNEDLDEDEDASGGTGEEGSDDGSKSSDIEVVEEPVTRKGLPKVSAVRKKPNPHTIDEEESSSDESGEYFSELDFYTGY
jgi:hypothetical protein